MQNKPLEFHSLAKKEWLVTNGLGGYASSTLCGANTRRYHGLLIASFNPPTDRKVLVSKVEERIMMEEDTLELSTNKYPGVIAPQGYQYLTSFERSPFPTAYFATEDLRLGKTVFMPYESNTTIVEYTNMGSKSFDLELTPLYVFRDYHGLFKASEFFDFYHEYEGNILRIYPHYGSSPLYCSISKGRFSPNPVWYYNFEYEKEEFRGLESREDARSIGQFCITLDPGEQVFLTFSTELHMAKDDPESLKAQELQRQHTLTEGISDPFLQDLVVSGNQFLVQRKSSDSQTVIAGYHWFTDWGRDTMIAMRGLAIAMGKQELSESILRTFFQYLDGGMIPNRFPDQGETPEYNTLDATLWIFVVLYEYYEKFQDKDFIEEVFPKLTEVLEYHRQGTRYDIHVTPEGLLYGGEGISQLTWMDARVGDYVVTPRQGCPVEINALWYNALCIYAKFGIILGKEVSREKQQAEQLNWTFRQHFWHDEGYLFDVVIPNSEKDASLRPNQIYAISLPFSPLTHREAESILSSVEKHLYTDLGLRSLAPDHPNFKALYGGNPLLRDEAYHQGTVWAFLWGEYALAYLKHHKFSPQAIETIKEKAEGLQRHFYEDACLHGISEIFDGENPRQGKGCIQQAWSIGMFIKVFQEIQQKQPEKIEI